MKRFTLLACASAAFISTLSLASDFSWSKKSALAYGSLSASQSIERTLDFGDPTETSIEEDWPGRPSDFVIAYPPVAEVICGATSEESTVTLTVKSMNNGFQRHVCHSLTDETPQICQFRLDASHCREIQNAEAISELVLTANYRCDQDDCGWDWNIRQLKIQEPVDPAVREIFGF